MHLGKSISQFFRLPANCLLCEQYHSTRSAICNACKAFFPRLGIHCQICALTLPQSNFLICGNCLKNKPDFDKVITAYKFDEPLRALLHEFKYEKKLYLNSFLAELMLEAWNSSNFKTECLVPVPMYRKRLWKKGFNHAAELTKYLARAINCPYHLTLCQKIKNTQPQAYLDKKQREKNLKNVFSSQPNSYQHVTVVDDLLTTGSTANALARSLKQQGVKTVHIWCCARVDI